MKPHQRVILYVAVIAISYGLSHQWMAVSQAALGGVLLGATLGGMKKGD
jgi:hypothetical protein